MPHFQVPLSALYTQVSGTDPGFQVRGAHLKKLRRAEGGAKIVGLFRVKNHDFTPKNLIFSNYVGGGAKIFGLFRVKNNNFPNLIKIKFHVDQLYHRSAIFFLLPLWELINDRNIQNMQCSTWSWVKKNT